MITIDTSAFVRFFSGDDLQKAKIVKQILESEEKLQVPDVVFPELEYVLGGQIYKMDRDKITDIFRSIIRYKNIKVSKKIKKAVDIYQNTKLDMADCIIAANSLEGKLMSFDNDLLSVNGVKKYS